MDVKDLSAIFRLSLANGFLSLDTDLPATDGAVFVRCPALPAGGEVTVMTARAAGGEGGLGLVQFNTPPNNDPSPVSKTMLSAFPNSVRISQDSELGPWTRSVQYIQQLPFAPDAEGEAPVKLYVNVTSTVSSEAPVKLLLTASSFVDLQKRHPAEVSLHLVPLFVLLQQEAILAPDPLVARQVLLRSDAAADPDLFQKVADLVAKLGNDDATVRGDAYTALDALGEPAAKALATIDRAALSAEQNATIDALLAARLGSSPTDAKAAAAQPLFLLDCLFLDEAPLRAAAFDRLKEQTKLPLTFDANAPVDVRRSQALKLRTQVTTWATSQPAREGN
jgi:hypothetical protein